MTLQSNHKLQLAAEFICYTNKHLFLTGKAGTGKTTFLQNLKNITFKRHVIVAPTGVAAINAGGVTIHSFFQLPFGPQIPEELAHRIPAHENDAKHAASRYHRFTKEKINIIKSIDLLVIDEISMVRADMLDAIDEVLRRHRDRNKPFGGLQLLMIGDLQQLAPIAKEDEWRLLRNYYESVYFFSSKALQKTDYVSIELTEVYRQSDVGFIDLLGKIRDNKLDNETIKILEKRHFPNFSPGEDEGYITLTTHNFQAYGINTKRLDALQGKTYQFAAEIKGEFPEYNYPTEKNLLLKIGSQVMFVKNDPSPMKEFYNGKIGKVIDIDDEIIRVQCPDDSATIEVGPLEWNNCKYSLDDNTHEISETVVGSFTQYPLKLAWAVTIHKSQGLTFDKAIIDANQAFAHGQVYVALSRCRTLEGMVLSSNINKQTLKTDHTISQYVNKIETNSPDEKHLEQAKHQYQQTLIAELFDFSIFQHRLIFLLRFIEKNDTHFDKVLAEVFHNMKQTLQSNIVYVAGNFMREVDKHLQNQPDIERNEPLQARIKKACVYFLPQFEEIIKMIPKIESDNKTVLKTATEQLHRFENEAGVKLASLAECSKGFNISNYLETRAKASIEKAYKTKKDVSEDLAPDHLAHPKLFNLIKQWRNRLANAENLSHYRIISRKAMMQIADTLPLNKNELLDIKGLGIKKIKQYGGEILDIIQHYIEENEMEEKVEDKPLVIPKKEAKPDSKKLSLDLYKQGKTIEDIAAERELAVSTIEGHLAYFVKTGELEIENLITPDKYALIHHYFTETEDLALGPAKTVLGDDVSWSELRFVANHIAFEQHRAQNE